MAKLFPIALEQIVAAGAEFIAVTGDLCDVPDMLLHCLPDFECDDRDLWRGAATADYQKIRTMLDSTGLPWMVLPGNHDWETPFWDVFDCGADVVELDDVVIARFVDREYVGHVPRRFDPARILWNDLRAREDAKAQIHLQHYVIEPVLNEGYPHSYYEAAHLRERLVAMDKPTLSLSGHYHKGTELITQKQVTFSTCPAFCVSPFPWRLYDFDLTTGHVAMQQFELGADALPARPCAFLDRDGVIGVHGSYRAGPEQFQLIEGSAQAITRLSQAGYAIAIISSQNAVGRGYYPREVVDMTHDRMCRLLEEECPGAGRAMDAIYYSTSDGKAERVIHRDYADHSKAKPSPYHIEQASRERNIDLSRSFMVGDRASDIQCAIAGGVQPVHVLTGHGEEQREQVDALLRKAGMPLIRGENLLTVVEQMVGQQVLYLVARASRP